MSSSADDPIAALATPAASSALAVIRVSGAGSLELLRPLVGSRWDPASAAGHTIHRCVLVDGKEPVDEVLVAVYRSPRSYTGEDGAEIFCHGSLPVITRLLSTLGRGGFRPAGPGEFTQRAFLNGRMGLTQAEAVNEIVQARTDRARGLALARLAGAIEDRVRRARDSLADLKAGLEVLIDYPDEEQEAGPLIDLAGLREAREALQSLVASYRQGRVFQEGVAVALAGATNCGKSRLFNLLLRQDRAIVSDTHGTTRDWLEATVSLGGIPVRLIDTAGLRPSTDPLESEGIRRTREVMASADIVVYLVDGARGESGADGSALAGLGSAVPVIKAWNKTDLAGCRPAPEGFVAISAAMGSGREELERRICEAALGGPPKDSTEPLVDSDRQRDLLVRAVAALDRFEAAHAQGTAADLLSVDLADCLDALGEISGAVTSAEILDRMFARFCVGK